MKVVRLIPEPFSNSPAPRPGAGELIQDRRARLALEEHERAYQRDLQLAEQRSSLNTPAVRIRVWEKLHALRLPSDSMHPILEVIAAGTQLTLAQVQEEQRARQATREQK